MSSSQTAWFALGFLDGDFIRSRCQLDEVDVQEVATEVASFRSRCSRNLTPRWDVLTTQRRALRGAEQTSDVVRAEEFFEPPMARSNVGLDKSRSFSAFMGNYKS